MRYDVGVQSFTYREFALDALPAELASTPVTAVELCDVHLAPTADERAVADAVEAFADVGIDVCGYGVVDVDDGTAIGPLFDLLDRLGAGYVSVDVPPSDDGLLRDLVDAAETRGIDVALHNHGPESNYATVEDVLAVLERHDSPRLGACVDTGHYLRAGQTVDEVIPALADRVHALHLTDFDDDGVEVAPGTGRTDLATLATLLDEHAAFHRPLVLEYEADPDDPTPVVTEAAAAIAGLDGNAE